MADYNLGEAKGKITAEYDGSGVEKAKKGFGEVDKSAKSSSEGMKKAATASTVAGAGIAAGLGLAAKTAMDFEKQISAIGAVSGATQQDLDMLSKKALQIGADTSFSATQAASAMEELAKAGISIPDIMNGAADATVALAAAGGVALPEAAELSADAMNAFALKAQDMPHIADLIAGAANASSISVSDFGQSLKQVGAVAQLTRTSFDDTAAAIALMGKMGIKGSDAGTSLKTMLMNLNPQTDKQKSLMRDLGLLTKDGANAFFDASGKAKGLADIAQLLQGSLKGMTQQQKLATLETLFGSDAIRAASVLSEQGAKGFNDVAAAMGKVSAEDVAAKRLDNTAGSMEQLKGSAETLAINLGMLLLPAVRKIVDGLNAAVDWFNNLSDGTKKTIVWIVGITGSILLLVGVVYKIMQAAKVFMVVWRALNLSFIASPIGLVVLAIIALVAIIVLIATKTTWFQDLWNAVWGAIKAAAKAVADWFMNTIVPSLKTAWDQLWSIIKWVIDKIVAYFKMWMAIYQWLWGVIKSIINAIVAYFKWWMGVYKSIWNAIVAATRWAINLVASIINAIKATVDKVVAWFKSMRDRVVSNLKGWIDYIKTIPGKIVSALGDLGRLLYNKGRDLVQGFIDGLKSMINKVKGVAGDIVGAVSRFLPGSPAKEGPLSGKGYVLLRAKRFGDDFREGILSKVAAARAAAQELAGSVSAAVPVDNRLAVATAVTNVGNATVAPVVTPASSGGSRDINIERLEIEGKWDLNDPNVPRRFVARLHEEIERYKKGYK